MKYSYDLPNVENYLKAVKALALTGSFSFAYESKLNEFFSRVKCNLIDTGKYSNKRWDTIGLKIEFIVPLDSIGNFTTDSIFKNIIDRACEKALPGNAGYDIIDISVCPDLYGDVRSDSVEEIAKVIEENKFLELDPDLVEKGKKMAEAYINLYCLENILRQFIHKTLEENLGNDYTNAISPNLRKSIEKLKLKEVSNKWLPFRGDNELYYLDFKDLLDVIIFNWEIFKGKFPDQQWIKVKLDELYNLRCLIAHNSFLSEDDFELLNVTSKQLIKQLK